jgi:two-component system nitrogen regulation response regulator NtrX
MAHAGQFKDDLLQRLNVLPLSIPPLRDRKSDIPLLVEHFKPQSMTFTKPTLEALSNYAWPGNIRELSNVIAYVTTMAEGVEIQPSDLPPKIRGASQGRAAELDPLSTPSATTGSFYDKIAIFERQLLSRAYEDCGGNISRMAQTLEMDRSHLYSKLREHGIHGGPAKS